MRRKDVVRIQFERNNRTKLILGLLIFSVIGACQNAPQDLVNSEALLFVKSSTNRTLDANFMGRSESSNLYMLSPISPNGKVTNLTNLTEPGAAVLDPEVSYDGLKVIFAMRRNRSESFNIWEMNIDGSNLQQLTNSPFDDCDPAYLPNGKIIFSSSRADFLDEYERRPVENLHLMDSDGGNVDRISFNNSDDFDPIVLRDGRVAWTRWEHHGTQNRFPLFFTHPDGQSTFLHFAPHGRNFFHARELENGKLVAVMSNRVLVDRGPVVILNSDQTTGDPDDENAFINLTPNVSISDGNFKFPSPLPDGRLVVSYAPSGPDGDYGLYTMERNGQNVSLLYNDPNMHELDAIVVTPRPRPQVIPESINKTATTGVFINQNVYFRQQRDGQQIPKPNEVKEIMVIEGLPQKSRTRNPHTSFESKRILGKAPVYADGSFAIEVPANTPFSINLLDSLGQAIVIKRSWLFARPGESFPKCTGCHGPRGMPSNPNPIAANQAPTNLDVAENAREVIAFDNAIAPIISSKCLSCHNGAAPAGNLDLDLTVPEGSYPAAYVNLLSSDRSPRLVETSRVPFSRRSYLVAFLLGIDERAGMQPHLAAVNASELTADEIRKIITWIDLGGQYQ